MVEAHYAEAITATPETDMAFTDVVFFFKYIFIIMVCELLLIALNLTIGMNTN